MIVVLNEHNKRFITVSTFQPLIQIKMLLIDLAKKNCTIFSSSIPTIQWNTPDGEKYCYFADIDLYGQKQELTKEKAEGCGLYIPDTWVILLNPPTVIEESATPFLQLYY